MKIEKPKRVDKVFTFYNPWEEAQQMNSNMNMNSNANNHGTFNHNTFKNG